MNIILHIGIPRTGTTFLQDSVFPNIDDINIVNFYGYKGLIHDVLARREIQKILIDIESFDTELAYNEINKFIIEGKFNLITNENIYCKMFKKDDKRFEKIDKIKEIFPKAKIIFGTRNSDDLLLSWYKKYVVNGGVLSYSDFIKEHINMDKINYEKYIEYLKKLFGKENVYIYKFENLKKNANSFVNGICKFIGTETPNFKRIKRNIGYSFWQTKVSILINNIYKTKLNPNGIIPLKYKYHPHRVIFQSPFFPKILRGQKLKKDNIKNL
jgi:hypothetical protein